MSNRYAGIVVLILLVLLSGCSAIVGTGSDTNGHHRFVVENEYDEAKNITVIIETSQSDPIVTETRRVTPGKQWVVTTVNASALTDGYTMEISGEYSSRFESSTGGAGATLIEMGGGRTMNCGGNQTCYK